MELYNTGTEAIDLSGGCLSDDPTNVYKWQFPEGLVIEPDAYMIVWADEDGSQGERHANSKLTASGEEVWLTDPDGLVLDHVVFTEQQANVGYARIPNGTGPFVEQEPTFSANNEDATSIGEVTQDPLGVYPNPATGAITISTGERIAVQVFDPIQRLVWSGTLSGGSQLDVSDWAMGTYTIQHAGGAVKLVVLR